MINRRRRAALAVLAPALAIAMVAVVAVVLVSPLRGSDTVSAATGFFAGFDGQPSSPASVTSRNTPGWDITVHTRGVLGSGPDTGWYQVEAMDAQHGPNCEAPHVTHRITQFEETVFRCRDHMMTALNASGYGAIYLTPNAMVDFSSGEATISWDMNTFRTSQRDWVDLWITPFDQQLQAPLEEFFPDLNGDPRNAIHIRMDFFNDQTLFDVYVVRNGVRTKLDRTHRTYEQVLTPDKSRRDKFELKLSRGRLTFGMPDYGLTWYDGAIPDMGFTTGVVQWGHHSYTPYKDGGNGPNTWHWDNFVIAPAVPYTMLPADRRYVDAGSATQTVNFGEGAPTGARLRFMGIGRVEVSFNGGATWQQARAQANLQKAAPEHFRSYFMTVPAGTQSVTFRGGPDQYQPDWHVRDISIVSASGSSAALPPPAASTPSAGASPTATAPPSASPAPTSTPPPTAGRPPVGGSPGGGTGGGTGSGGNPGVVETPPRNDGVTALPLQPGRLNAVTYLGQEPAAVEDVLGPIMDGILSVFRFDAETQRFEVFTPGAPAVFNSLTEVRPDDALMIRMKGGSQATWLTPALATDTESRREVPLVRRLNAVGYTGPDGTDIRTLLAPIQDQVSVALAFDSEAQRWLVFIPRGPAWLNTLRSVDHRDVLFLQMRQAATLTLPVGAGR